MATHHHSPRSAMSSRRLCRAQPMNATGHMAGKRSFEDSFPQSTARQNQPLFGGRRPSLMESKDPDNDEEDLEEPPNMVYKRADGSNQQRPIPYVTSDEQ
jgi:hypothetical protein